MTYKNTQDILKHLLSDPFFTENGQWINMDYISDFNNESFFKIHTTMASYGGKEPIYNYMIVSIINKKNGVVYEQPFKYSQFFGEDNCISRVIKDKNKIHFEWKHPITKNHLDEFRSAIKNYINIFK